MTPPRVLTAAGVSAGGNPGKDVGASLRGASGTPPLRFAREWAAAGACPSSGPAGPPSPKGEGKGCCWRQRKPPRGVGDAAPCGLPGEGRREPAPHPALRGHLPPRGKAKAVVEGFIPPGVLAAAGGRGGVGAPRPTDGDMETLWGLRGHPFPGRRTVGAGHARPGGLRRHPSMVRSVGRGLDPSAGGCPGDGRWREVSRNVGDAAPYGLPGNGRRREAAAGWGHPALRMGIWKRCGVYADTRFRAAAR